MPSIHSKATSCRLCGDTKLKCVVPMNPIPIGEHYTETKLDDAERYPIDIYQCPSCGAVQTLDNIDPSFLWKDYTYFSGQTNKIVEHFSEFCSKTLSQFPDKKSILDIGSNDGSLLRQFKDKGLEVVGIDPADTVVDVANASGINTFLGLFNEQNAVQFFPEKKFDIITAFNVFAHSQEMPSMLKGVQYLLADDGVFCFEVQYLSDIINKSILGTFFHEHMIHYSYYSAEQFMNSADLTIVDFDRNNIQNGSIIFYACFKNSTAAVTSRRTDKLEALKNEELNLGVDNFSWSYSFNSAIARTRSSAMNFLENIESLCAYGAARSGPTLALQFEVDKKLARIFDDHPSKVGKFSPFLGIRVEPTSNLSADKVDYCVILAYIHYKNIIRKHHDYILQGGKFILLWPEFRVVDEANCHEFL